MTSFRLSTLNRVAGRLAAAAVLALATLPAKAADGDTPKKWAVFVGFNTSSALLPSDGSGRSMGRGFGSPGLEIGAEYYIPSSHFSVIGRYSGEELSYYGSDVTTGLSQVMVGSRYYPLSRRFVIQPYIGAGAYVNFGDKRSDGWMSLTSAERYRRNFDIDNTRFSVAPMAGFDIYVFSSIALEIDYGFRLGIGGRSRIDNVYARSENVYIASSRMNRHTIAFGLKVVFPFSFNRNDTENLLDLILISLGAEPEERPHVDAKTRRAMKIKDTLRKY